MVTVFSVLLRRNKVLILLLDRIVHGHRLYGIGFLVLLPFIFGDFSGDEYFIRMSVGGIKATM